MPDCPALGDTCLNKFSLYFFFKTGETDNKKVNERIAGDDKCYEEKKKKVRIRRKVTERNHV